ncbi:hypothetical protein LguiA_011913 [Lonicera macranthoides]
MFSKTSDGNRRVKILSHLSNYPIIDGPHVHPRELASLLIIVSLHKNHGPKCKNGERFKYKRVMIHAGEQPHQVLARGRAVEPPLEVRGNKTVHRVDVACCQGFVEVRDHFFVGQFISMYVCL